MNPKFDRVESLAEILAILDESQGIRERLDDLNKRITALWSRIALPISPVGLNPAIEWLKAFESALGDVVDNDLAVTAKELSKKTKIMLDNSPEDY